MKRLLLPLVIALVIPTAVSAKELCTKDPNCYNNAPGLIKYRGRNPICGVTGCYHGNLSRGEACRYDEQCPSRNCKGNNYGLTNGICK